MSVSGTHGNVVENGFTVVPLKVKQDDQVAHHLFLKQHRAKESDGSKPQNKTLFVVNVPPYCTKDCLKNMFSKCGQVSRVYLHDRPTSGAPPKNLSKYFSKTKEPQGFKVAYVVFKHPEAVSKATEWSFDKPFVLETDSAPLLTGLAKWTQVYEMSVVDVNEMQVEIDSFMVQFDATMEEDKQKAKETEGVPDEEGWMTVNRHSNKVARRTETNDKRLKANERKKKKETELLNFYRFQVRETKQKQIVTLRQKFEEDKQRIALMKASRKFRPY
ncbi:ribosomal RNA-processing protein 7 homolog A-like [Gigantopelta aegis]|uniref:ribosomal RNA-processing protein 7 homolog A-like n=1 Tax=Gigantopelta aegis TaxID=1735272 RepID=UPI001B88B5BB|nr:ribosomal RNA-processing protein 7 homolog A-like [Gigantopelta aegis]